MIQDETERAERIQSAEQNMNEVLNNPQSTYTEQAEAIDSFFRSW